VFLGFSASSAISAVNRFSGTFHAAGASVMLEGMTLLDAREYDEEKERRKRRRIISSASLVLAILLVLEVGGALFFKTPLWFLYWPQERVAERFFDALQNQNYEAAYGIWMHDPQWRQHIERYRKYPFNEFYRDWGPGGEWGRIKSHKIYAVGSPPGGGSGVIVDVTVNDRVEPARVWVQNSDKTMSFSPY
jgi:hypothetical protein